MTTPAVLYAAKSTEDVHGSIPTQLADCRAACGQPAPEFSDEAASAYHGNRGAGLTAAKEAAIRLAAEHGTCELWVQHSDRLARGDGITADHLGEVWFALRRNHVRLRSVQDDHNLEDAIRVVLMGERGFEDSDRKAKATRDGLKRRWDRGQPTGRLPYGYRVETTIRDGKPVTERVIDPERAKVIERILDGIEGGMTPGEVARFLNADGVPTSRGRQWVAKTVANTAQREAYAGHGGYPALISQERHERVMATLTRSVPARKGGRPGGHEFLLKGLLTTGHSTYYGRVNRGGSRSYVCAGRRRGGSNCNCKPVPAELVERAVIKHLHGFLGDVEAWLAERTKEENSERERFAEAIVAQRAELKRLEVRAQRAHAQHDRLLDAGDDLADDALRIAIRKDREATDLADTIWQAEARLAEMPTTPEVDDALSFYRELSAAVSGRLSETKTVVETNLALRNVLKSARVFWDGPQLVGLFVLRETDLLPRRTYVLSDAGMHPAVMSRDLKAEPSPRPWS